MRISDANAAVADSPEPLAKAPEPEMTAVCSIICVIMNDEPIRKPTASGVRYAICRGGGGGGGGEGSHSGRGRGEHTRADEGPAAAVPCSEAHTKAGRAPPGTHVAQHHRAAHGKHDQQQHVPDHEEAVVDVAALDGGCRVVEEDWGGNVVATVSARVGAAGRKHRGRQALPKAAMSCCTAVAAAARRATASWPPRRAPPRGNAPANAEMTKHRIHTSTTIQLYLRGAGAAWCGGRCGGSCTGVSEATGAEGAAPGRRKRTAPSSPRRVGGVQHRQQPGTHQMTFMWSANAPLNLSEPIILRGWWRGPNSGRLGVAWPAGSCAVAACDGEQCGAQQAGERGVQIRNAGPGCQVGPARRRPVVHGRRARYFGTAGFTRALNEMSPNALATVTQEPKLGNHR